MMRLDLNCDLGESFGAYILGQDHEVIPWITSANVACGYHAGDALVMERTVRACKAAGVAVGAHPGFPDLEGFGRREMAISSKEAKAYIQYQVGALWAFCRAQGVPLCHVKPHGALYNMAARDETLAVAICEGIAEVDPKLRLLALAGSKMIDVSLKMGTPVAQEVFADRAYEDDGSLVARSKPGAMITDEDLAIARVIEMAKTGNVYSVSGKKLSLNPDSVCVHGDSEKALDFVKKIRKSLEKNGIQVLPLNA